MRIAVARETRAGERRVALVPDEVATLTGLGYTVTIEPGAGRHALIADDEYADAGALLEGAALDEADVVLSVQPLMTQQVRRLRTGAATMSLLPAGPDPKVLRALLDASITSFALERVPRTSRAQPMDALSSQALVSGYRGAIVAAGMLRRFFPSSITAAGTVPPARVVVLGAGVAGLEAIATARRLGALVQAYDVRAASAEEIRSLGAEAIDLGLEPLEGASGYAREMTAERSALQQERLTPYVAAADALITTAAVPARPAPVLVTRAMVEQMGAGSVVVDLAAESGGNVEGAVAGTTVRIGHALVWGAQDVASQMPGPASRLYARNVVSLVALMTVDGTFAPDFADEIVAGSCVTRDGALVTSAPSGR